VADCYDVLGIVHTTWPGPVDRTNPATVRRTKKKPAPCRERARERRLVAYTE